MTPGMEVQPSCVYKTDQDSKHNNCECHYFLGRVSYILAALRE